MGPTNLSPQHSGAITLLSTGLVSECPPVTLSPRQRWQMCRELLLSDPNRHAQRPQQCLHGTGRRRALVHFTGKQARRRACGNTGRLARSHRPVYVRLTLLKIKRSPFGGQKDHTTLYMRSCISVELGYPLTLGIPCTRDSDTLFGEYQIQITRICESRAPLSFLPHAHTQ